MNRGFSNIITEEIEDIETRINLLLCQFDSVSMIHDREKAYRKKQINIAFENYKTERTIESLDRLLQLTHEIESYLFLSQIGKTVLSSDAKSTPGADILFNNHIFVECVCMAVGDASLSGLSEYLGFGNYDYNKKSGLINERITNSLKNKTDFYYKHVGKSIPDNAPYIILLSPGILRYGWFEEEYGMALSEVTLGRGNPTLYFDRKTGKYVSSDYSHTDSFKKWNNADIDSNYFLDRRNGCVSGIMLATEILQNYSVDDVFLHLNPYAANLVDPLEFGDMVYWTKNQQGRYQAFKRGMPINTFKNK